MDDRRLVRVSKYLAKHLRHQPQRLGLALDAAGWVEVDALLRACEQAGFALTRAELEEVVARNDKRRFAFDETGARIRASQGHSIGVDLGLRPLVPPDELYHGTIAAMLPAILDEGLRPMGRHHVHLSVRDTTGSGHPALGAAGPPASVWRWSPRRFTPVVRGAPAWCWPGDGGRTSQAREG
jgi:putative RNA 2'-phosphotransferase